MGPLCSQWDIWELHGLAIVTLPEPLAIYFQLDPLAIVTPLDHRATTTLFVLLHAPVGFVCLTRLWVTLLWFAIRVTKEMTTTLARMR